MQTAVNLHCLNDLKRGDTEVILKLKPDKDGNFSFFQER